MEKILVTGGAGYIGSILTPQLLKAGYSVTVLDNFKYKQTSLLDVCNNKNLDIIVSDIRDKSLIEKQVAKHDIIFPLAAIVGAPACAKDTLTARSTNVDTIHHLASILGKGHRVIFPTTNSGYGIGIEGIYCTEETPLRPISQYGKEKVEVERRLLDTGVAISFRLATVFGISPRMRLDLLVNDFVYRAIYDRSVTLFEAHFKRNYIHVRDVASAFLFALKNFDSMKGEIFNHGLNEANLSKRELCETIKEYIPNFYFHEAEIGEDPDKRNYIVSNDKLKATGYRTSVTLKDGIQELIKGYRIIRKFGFDNL